MMLSKDEQVCRFLLIQSEIFCRIHEQKELRREKEFLLFSLAGNPKDQKTIQNFKENHFN
jgi:hypothetical protein